MPRILGNVTSSPEYPRRVNNSERLSPKAFTLISTQPGCGVGIGTCLRSRPDTSPGASRTTARIMAFIRCLHRYSSWRAFMRVTFEWPHSDGTRSA